MVSNYSVRYLSSHAHQLRSMKSYIQCINTGTVVTQRSDRKPVAKRRKATTRVKEVAIEKEELLVDIPIGVPPHPLGIKPLGNAYDAKINIKRNCGIFTWLPDELLISVLEYLDAATLVRLGGACKALYAFCREEELWKSIFVKCVCNIILISVVVLLVRNVLRPFDRSPPAKFCWRGTWRSTYLCLRCEGVTSIPCMHLYSDVLYRPFYCARVNLASFVTNIPTANQIPLLHNLSPEDFSETWTDKPFILTEPVTQWPIFHTWSIPNLLSKYSKTIFRAEAVDWPLETYLNYMKHNSDESPLYLFDHRFAEKMKITIGDSTSTSQPTASFPVSAYSPPPCFGPDLFMHLGPHRPAHRWLILGPARSGSTFHKDPNATSAWNAVLVGSKYWIMFPSSSSLPPPPGVFVSADQGEIMSPLSIAEWLLSFHGEARRLKGCKEGICTRGEVLHVPSGWYHLVVNLEESLAVTQNFVPRAHLANVLEFLRDKKAQVSGFEDGVKDPYGLFVERLKVEQPVLLEEAVVELDGSARAKKGLWQDITRKNDGHENKGFSFGFGGDDEDGNVP